MRWKHCLESWQYWIALKRSIFLNYLYKVIYSCKNKPDKLRVGGEMAPFWREVLMLLRGAGDPCDRWDWLLQRWLEGFPKRSGRFSCWTVNHSKPNIETARTEWARLELGLNLFLSFLGGSFVVGYFCFIGPGLGGGVIIYLFNLLPIWHTCF